MQYTVTTNSDGLFELRKLENVIAIEVEPTDKLLSGRSGSICSGIW